MVKWKTTQIFFEEMCNFSSYSLYNCFYNISDYQSTTLEEYVRTPTNLGKLLGNKNLISPILISTEKIIFLAISKPDQTRPNGQNNLTITFPIPKFFGILLIKCTFIQNFLSCFPFQYLLGSLIFIKINVYKN